MAQTRTITRRKLVALRGLDVLSRLLRYAVRPRPISPEKAKSFLVVEPWGIGDVVLATVVIRSIRAHFPDARITLLAKPHGVPLLANSGLVDEIIPFDFPWTAFTGKFRLTRYPPRAFVDLFRQLRARNFDVSLDARRDIRSNVITYLAGARRRIGFDFGGGSHLLTDVLPSGSQDEHKISDWLSLLAPLGIAPDDDPHPRLTITPAERLTARNRLDAMGYDANKPLIGIHAGASHPVRRWNAGNFTQVIDALFKEGLSQIVIFEEKPGDSAEIVTSPNVRRIASELRDFMAMVSECALLVCSDSGPMHIAGALGVPVTALFGPQRKEWYGPGGELDKVVQIDHMPCRPCFDACIYASPRCMDDIRPSDVVVTVRAQITDLGNSVFQASSR